MAGELIFSHQPNLPFLGRIYFEHYPINYVVQYEMVYFNFTASNTKEQGIGDGKFYSWYQVSKPLKCQDILFPGGQHLDDNMV